MKHLKYFESRYDIATKEELLQSFKGDINWELIKFVEYHMTEYEDDGWLCEFSAGIYEHENCVLPCKIWSTYNVNTYFCLEEYRELLNKFGMIYTFYVYYDNKINNNKREEHDELSTKTNEIKNKIVDTIKSKFNIDIVDEDNNGVQFKVQ